MRMSPDILEEILRDPGFPRAAEAIASSGDPSEALMAQISSDLAEGAHPTGKRVAFRGVAKVFGPRIRRAEDRVARAVTGKGGEDSDIVRGIGMASQYPEAELREFLEDIAEDEISPDFEEDASELDGLGDLGKSKSKKKKKRRRWIKYAAIAVATVVTAGAAGVFAAGAAALPAVAGAGAAGAGAAASGGIASAILPTVLSVGGSLAMGKLGPKPPKPVELPSDLTYDPSAPGAPEAPGGLPPPPATKPTDYTPFLIGGAVLLVAVMALKK